MRIAGLGALFAIAIVTAACTTGDGTKTDPEGILCSAQATTMGSFTPDPTAPAPTGYACWPIGTWTFSAVMVAGQDDCPQLKEPDAMPLPQYQFKGTVTMDQDGNYDESFAYLPAANDPNVNSEVKANEGGDGVCEGDLLLFDATGTQVWSLKPELNADNTIGGTGSTYTVYGKDQWDPNNMP